MERTPCLVSFSGGQDSSLVLAAATQLARREGRADPIPVTWRSRAAAGADETAWQEAVVAELGLDDWVRMETGDALDYVGPVAARVVERHGVLYPPNAHVHEPLAAEAAGGALLTGIGGDQVFGLWRWARAAAARGRRVPFEPRDAVRIAHAHAPVAVRRAIATRRAGDVGRHWLTPSAERAFARRYAADIASEPPTWAARLEWQLCRRSLAFGRAALDVIGSAHDCRIVHPLVDPRLIDAVGRAADPHGFPDRSAALPALFPTLHPQTLRTRRDKAVFRDVFTRDASREAAQAWAGEGVDPALVDIAELQAIWQDRVPLGSALILQQFALQPRSGPVTPR